MKQPSHNNWNTPKSRTAFKWHALIYFIIIMLLWVMWYIGLKTGTQTYEQRTRFPWPTWPMVVWGIILIYHYNAVFGKRKSLPKDYVQDKDHSKTNKH